MAFTIYTETTFGFICTDLLFLLCPFFFVVFTLKLAANNGSEAYFHCKLEYSNQSYYWNV